MQEITKMRASLKNASDSVKEKHDHAQPESCNGSFEGTTTRLCCALGTLNKKRGKLKGRFTDRLILLEQVIYGHT